MIQRHREDDYISICPIINRGDDIDMNDKDIEIFKRYSLRNWLP